jgi:hypothetical protein
MMAPNGTRFSGWLLNTSDKSFGAIADYSVTGEPRSSWSARGVLGFSACLAGLWQRSLWLPTAAI